MKKGEITHIFLGDDLTFLSRKFIRNIVETSSLVHRFVIFTHSDSFDDWGEFFTECRVSMRRTLFLSTDIRGGLGKVFGRVWNILRLLSFSSHRILSHRRHYNIFLLFALRCIGKRIAFMSWGDIPKRAKGIRGSLQRMQFSCYSLGLVQISSEVPAFKQLRESLAIVTIPYLRNNTKVISSVNHIRLSAQRCLLLGNNSWCYNLYKPILAQIDWEHWDRVICMLNYGNPSEQKEIEAFCQETANVYGAKVELWRERVPFEKYLDTIRECTMYIYPGLNQGGIDLAYNMLLMGKRVALRGVNLLWLQTVGCDVLDLDEIDIGRCGLIEPLSQEVVARNRKIVCELTDKNETNIKKWDDIFLRI